MCDDDIDGDGVKNPVGIVDAPGYVITSLLTPTSDNCLFTPNSDQKNIDTTPLGDACTSTKISATSSPLQALQIAATPMRGPVPLTVLFTSDVVGSTQDLLRDFDTSELV